MKGNVVGLIKLQILSVIVFGGLWSLMGASVGGYFAGWDYFLASGLMTTLLLDFLVVISL